LLIRVKRQKILHVKAFPNAKKSGDILPLKSNGCSQLEFFCCCSSCSNRIRPAQLSSQNFHSRKNFAATFHCIDITW